MRILIAILLLGIGCEQGLRPDECGYVEQMVDEADFTDCFWPEGDFIARCDDTRYIPEDEAELCKLGRHDKCIRELDWDLDGDVDLGDIEAWELVGEACIAEPYTWPEWVCVKPYCEL